MFQDILPLIELKGITGKSRAFAGKNENLIYPFLYLSRKLRNNWKNFGYQAGSCMFCFLFVENSVSIHK